MNSGHFASKQSAIADSFTDDGLSGDRVFFSSLQQREVVATLRYGIEARKGLILCTGDAGTGKSMLLHKLESELGPDITCLMIADPYLSFGEIVRRLLHSLQPSSETESEARSLDRCRELLRAQLTTGRITALVFDDAHHLRDEIIQKLLQTWIGGGDGERDRNLVQVVLIGRPELKERLFQPPLGSLVAVECRLQPLNKQETADYIRQRLRAADLPEELFEHEALARIAHYAGGNFRQANALCERAIRTAQSSSRTQITREIVDGAAKDLDLWQPRWVRKENVKTSVAAAPRFPTAPADPLIPPRNRRPLPDHPHEPFRFQFADDDLAEAAGKTFVDFAGTHDRPRVIRRRGRNSLFLGSLMILSVVLIAGVWLYRDTVRQAVGVLNGKLHDVTKIGQTPTPAMETSQVPPYELPREPLTSSSSVSEGSPIPPEYPPTIPTPPNTFEEPALAPISPAPESLPENPPIENKQAVRPSTPARVTPPTPTKPRYDLETEVFKAIQNRAIEGVRVSVSDDIVFLDGRVATERQKRAAETAAQGVPGVRAVRNRIALQ